MTANQNPLLQAWSAADQFPPFDRVQAEHFAPAFEVLFEQHLQQVEAIAGDRTPATFANTVEAFDQAGRQLALVEMLLENLIMSETSPALQAVEMEMAGRLADHHSAISLHPGFFERLNLVYQARQELELNEEQRRLLERLHLDFVRAGAMLQGQARERYAVITSRLAQLTTQFSQNILADEAEYRLVLKDADDLAGLPEFVLSAARSAAVERDLEGHVITLSRSLITPFLTYSKRRDLRQAIWSARVARGTHPERDNRPVAREILALRVEQAALLGYKNFADYALADRMAGQPAAVYALLEQVWEPAKQSLAAERVALVEVARELGEPEAIEGWDWLYLAEKVRAARFNLDVAEVKPYFSLEAMVAAMFDCAQRLFGLSFTERHDVPLYHADARLWDVKRHGQAIGYFIGDNFARASKRGGAWMHNYRGQGEADGKMLPIVVNNNNFAKSSDGRTLLSFDDVRTLFHEFGHGLHGLLSEVTYQRISGTNVPQDYVELPSQLFENWAKVQEVLERHARHIDTGAVIPAALLDKIRAAETFNQGYETVRYTASALVDLALHQRDDADGVDIAEFEAAECARLGVPAEAGMNHYLSHFGHIFSGDSYAAGYYVYMWAEVLEAEAFEAFEETGNAFDPVLAEKLHRYIYSAGDKREQRAAFRAFRGRDPQAGPMLQKRGLVHA